MVYSCFVLKILSCFQLLLCSLSFPSHTETEYILDLYIIHIMFYYSVFLISILFWIFIADLLSTSLILSSVSSYVLLISSFFFQLYNVHFDIFEGFNFSGNTLGLGFYFLAHSKQIYLKVMSNNSIIWMTVTLSSLSVFSPGFL